MAPDRDVEVSNTVAGTRKRPHTRPNALPQPLVPPTRAELDEIHRRIESERCIRLDRVQALHEHVMRCAMLRLQGSLCILEGGTALIRGVIADAPRFRLRNRARQGVRHFEIAWLVRDARGTVYSVGSAPVDQLDRVGPQERFETRADGRFRIHPVAAGRPPAIEAVSAYLRSAQLDDGSVWVPSRQALQASNLIEAVPVSAEEQRLSQLYRERGAEAVAAELRRLAGADTGASAR